MRNETVRIAAMADIHCTEQSAGQLRTLFATIADRADILLLCGDLTHVGSLAETEVLIEELSEILQRMPVLGVLGNHDYEYGRPEDVFGLLVEAGVVMLDGGIYETHGIGFTGVKGFAGGFGERALQPWGEAAIKAFVKEAQEEAAKLTAGLSKLNTHHRIVLCHYSPIAATVDGERPEVFPFLGSSHLEEPLNRYQPTAAFHGHAHHGRLEGRTRDNTPVYNVSISVLQQHMCDQRPFRTLSLTPDRSYMDNPEDSL